MELTGAAGLGEQTMQQMTDAFEGMPGLPPGFAEKFMELAKPEELVDLVVPIYREHLDEETIDAAIAFAETPAGKALYAALPKISAESMQAGRARRSAGRRRWS